MSAGLIAKPCHSCGRIITPRPKWARNWAEIRFCSDRCRSERSVRLGGRGNTISCPAGLTTHWKTLAIGRALQPVDPPHDQPAEAAQPMRLDVDAWAEEALLRLAGGMVTVSKDMHGWALVSDAEKIIRQEARNVWGSTVDSPDQIARGDDQSDKLDSGHEPDQQDTLSGETASERSGRSISSGTLGSGLRERVRRAARRRIVLDPTLWARAGGDHLEVWGTPVLPGGRKDVKVRGGPMAKAKAKRTLPVGVKRLESLDDVSYARGEMYLRVRAEGS